MGALFEDIDILGEDQVFVPAPLAPSWGDEDDALEVSERAPVPALDPWPPRLPLEIALCSSYEEQCEIIQKFGLTLHDFDRIQTNPEFRRSVAEAAAMIRESGYGFKAKCRAIAEDFLSSLDGYLYKPDVGLGQKLDIFKVVTRLGELEPQPKKPEAAQQTQPQVNIMINL